MPDGNYNEDRGLVNPSVDQGRMAELGQSTARSIAVSPYRRLLEAGKLHAIPYVVFCRLPNDTRFNLITLSPRTCVHF